MVACTQSNGPEPAGLAQFPPRARVPFAGDGRTGDLLIVPDSRHALAAIEDSAILLTVSKAAYPGSP